MIIATIKLRYPKYTKVAKSETMTIPTYNLLTDPSWFLSIL